MLKHMQTWQRALFIALILICVGTSLAHEVEAAIDSGHGSHCSVCITGASSPLLPADYATQCADFTSVAPPFALFVFFERQAFAPDYFTRAPPAA